MIVVMDYLLQTIFFIRNLLILKVKKLGSILFNYFQGDNRELAEEYDPTEQCYICLDYIRCPVVTKLLSCTHNGRFHLACIWKWVTKVSVYNFNNYGVFNVTCPICRKEDIAQICNAPFQNRRFHSPSAR